MDLTIKDKLLTCYVITTTCNDWLIIVYGVSYFTTYRYLMIYCVLKLEHNLG